MTSYKNAVDYAADQMKHGKINAAQANVLIVKMMGIRVIKGKLPADVRKALNDAVKVGELGRLAKDGLKPEIYHHKNARAKAFGEQERIATASINSIKNCLA